MPDTDNSLDAALTPELQESILTSEVAKRMVERVTPIYANSYVGLWMFETIGEEYDRLWEIINSISAQILPSTATWSLELWERRYGIIPPAGSSIELRRAAIEQKRHVRPPLSPFRLEQLCEMLTGNPAHVEDHIGPYTFGVQVTASSLKVLKEVNSLIRKIKPSHLSYELENNAPADTPSNIYAATAQTGAKIVFGSTARLA